ncbi:sensor histidine kinase [Ferruginibacter sp. SUN106]|uniref:sensor histidine kinase n=1 Tax=Ferruginibacter sp. SUN106 TaxID=2978348 RepID=UPI003D361AE9
MRSSATRLIIFITTILIAVIIGLQMHWLNKTYSFEKKEFKTSVVKCIRGLYEDLDLADEPGTNLTKLIESPNENTFIFRVDDVPPRDTLINALMNEFDDFKVYTDCKVAAYDDSTKKYAYEAFLPTAASIHPVSIDVDAPNSVKNYSFVYLNFPNRSSYILGNMSNWIFTIILLLVLLIGLGASIYYLYRQKFLNDIQKDFINNVTHEFSTPLTVIDLSTDALQKPGIAANPEKYNKYVASIKYQNEYLKKHIQTLVKTVVTESYHLALDKTTIHPEELIKRAIVQLEPIVFQKNGKIIFEEPEETNETIIADSDNLYLAIFNIISNAVKYSETPKIIITTGIQHFKYFISVKDNGVGIAAAEQQKIFKKFYRAQNGNIHNAKGLGLGLYFVKKIIELHHGLVEVNSVEGIGTEFKIILPIN